MLCAVVLCERFSEAVRAALDRLDLPPENDKDLICDLMVSREKLMTTAVGDGVAVPHVRVPVVVNVLAPVFGVFFLSQPIDMNALDGQPVHTLFVLLSLTPKQHLELLARLAFFSANRSLSRCCVSGRMRKQS